MTTPHKHANEIKAWAEGATIQFLQTPDTWVDCFENRPSWNLFDVYRVKPQPKADKIKHAQITCCSVYGTCMNNVGEMLSEDDNIKMTFDGETGELKAVELVNQKSS